MPFIFSFRHMDTSEALETYSEQKLRQTIERFNLQPVRVQVTFDAEKQHRIICSITISEQGHNYHVEDQGNYAYDCVDRAIGKLDAQFRKAHDKAKPRHETLRVVNDEEDESKAL